jgi:hypothetical protein
VLGHRIDIAVRLRELLEFRDDVADTGVVAPAVDGLWLRALVVVTADFSSAAAADNYKERQDNRLCRNQCPKVRHVPNRNAAPPFRKPQGRRATPARIGADRTLGVVSPLAFRSR